MAWRRRWGVLLALTVALAMAGCEDVTLEAPQPVTLVIAGSTSMRPVLRELTATFGRHFPEVRFDLRGGGSTLGEEQARAGTVTLGATTLLAPTDDAGAPVADGLHRVPIGLDGLAVVVHPGNPVANLTLLNLRDLYAGSVLDWIQVGGRPGEILLVSREEGSGSRRTFESRVMGETSVSLTAVVMPSAADVVEYVAETPSAVGYVSRGYVAALFDDDPTNDAAVGVRAVPVEGALPTLEKMAGRSYFLIQPLYLVSTQPPAGRVRQFIDFAVGPAGQEIVARFHAPVR